MTVATTTVALDPAAVAQRSASCRPWSAERLIWLLVLNAIGLILLGVSAYETHNQSTVRDQLAWMNLAIGGLGLAGVANGLWLFRGRQIVGLARQQVLPARRTQAEVSDDAAVDAGTAPLVIGAGMTHFHRAGCLLVAGRATRSYCADDRLAGVARPCGVCEP